jgi:hypothetical protein
VLLKMSEVHAMIARAEPLLWPGQPPQADIAILQPRSSEVWDPVGVSDATNVDLNRFTVDYMAEIYDLYRGLQQENIPADFVPEDVLTDDGLRGYKVLYVTEPDFPREYVPALLKWVRNGGTLVSVSGAFSRDRYDEPMAEFQEARGIVEAPRPRLMLPNADFVPVGGRIDDWEVSGVEHPIAASQDTVLANFENGKPAIVERKDGRGLFIHYAFLPGTSAYRSRNRKADYFSATALKWICYPARRAAVVSAVQVDSQQVETPLLLSPAGAAITLLDWRNESISAAVHVTARTGFQPKSVESVTRGALEFVQQGDRTTFELPLQGADIVLLRK